MAQVSPGVDGDDQLAQEPQIAAARPVQAPDGEGVHVAAHRAGQQLAALALRQGGQRHAGQEVLLPEPGDVLGDGLALLTVTSRRVRP